MVPGTMWNAAHELLAFERYCCVAAMTKRHKVRCHRHLANAPIAFVASDLRWTKACFIFQCDKFEGTYEMLAILAGVSHLVPGTLWNALRDLLALGYLTHELEPWLLSLTPRE